MRKKIWQLKTLGCCKSSAKREVFNNTSLPQETRETSNKQPKYTPKANGKRTKTPKVSRKKKKIIKIRSETSEKGMMETIAKINKTKSLFFKKINKINKLLARLLNKNREKTQINKIRNKNGEIITDNTEIQKIIRDYFEELYVNKMDNLEEMDTFLEKYNLSKLNQKEI